jgi:hypothetical protein
MNETPINLKIHWSQCVIHYSNKCVWYKIMPRSESTSFTIIINMAFRMKPLSIKINKLVFILRGLLLWIPVFCIILFFQKIDLLMRNKLLIFLKIRSNIKKIVLRLNGNQKFCFRKKLQFIWTKLIPRSLFHDLVEIFLF